MKLIDWITAIIAAYGAILSTYLAFREVGKERRKLKMTLEFMMFYGKARLIVANSGHRSLTIRNIKLSIALKSADGNESLQNVPTNALFLTKEPEFPKFLGTGETVIYELSEVLSHDIGEIIHEGTVFNIKGKINISLYDTEGNIYTRYSRWENYSK